MNLNYQQRRSLAILSLIAGATLVLGGMLTTGNTVLPSWAQGLIILTGFLITTFGTRQLRCSKCHKFPDWHTGECQQCKASS